MPSPTVSEHLCLLRAIRIVIAADSDPARQVLFGNLMQARPSVRVAYRAYTWVSGTPAAALLVSCYGAAYFLRIGSPRVPQAQVWSVAKHVNARRQVERVSAWVGASDCTRIPIGFGVGLSGAWRLLTPAAWPTVRRLLRIVARLEGTRGFLVACRVAAAVAWYARTKAMLEVHRPSVALVSSDSNPEEVGFLAAARALGIARVFVSHAYPTPFSPRLDFSLSILEGAAAVAARERKGPIAGEVVFAGVEGQSAPLEVSRFERATPVVGIFAPKALSWTTLGAIVADLRQRFHARKIVIRWHPSRLDPAKNLHLLGDLSGIEESPTSASLAEVASQCDWVVADENSNVHLPVLKLGIPTVAVKRLGLYPESRSDMYGFAAGGVVYPPVDSLLDLSLEGFTAFFGSGWLERFRRYDASYMRSDAAVSTDVPDAVRRCFVSAPRAVAHV